MATYPESGDALDVLEYEDRVLRLLLDRLVKPDDALTHGVVGKLLIRHLAIREEAKEVLADVLSRHAVVIDHAEHLQIGVMTRRHMIAHLDEMARGVRPIDLNQAQDFDAELEPLKKMLDPEISDELDDVLPALREALSTDERKKLLPNARYIRRHAPTHPNDHARHRYERIGPLVRFHAWYDGLREYPTGNSWARKKLSELTDLNET